ELRLSRSPQRSGPRTAGNDRHSIAEPPSSISSRRNRNHKGSTKLTKKAHEAHKSDLGGLRACGLRELCGFRERVVVSATALVPPQTVLRGSLKELPRDVEAERPVVLVGAAAGDLRHSGAERVREVQLEQVAADAL